MRGKKLRKVKIKKGKILVEDLMLETFKKQGINSRKLSEMTGMAQPTCSKLVNGRHFTGYWWSMIAVLRVLGIRLLAVDPDGYIQELDLSEVKT